jgi:hypothetical protein
MVKRPRILNLQHQLLEALISQKSFAACVNLLGENNVKC